MLQSPANPLCANILRLLLGIPMPLTYKPATSPLTHPNLTDEQRVVIQHLKGNCPILFQQAPAGTGKTFVIAAFIQEYMQNSPNEIVFLAATTNMAVSNMAQAVLKLMPQLSPNELLYLQSLTNERLVNADDYLWNQHRLPELMTRLIPLDHFHPDELNFARDYTGNRLPHDGKGCHETKALYLALKTNTVRIILGTVAMLEQYLPVLKNYIQRCIFDEAGLIPEAQLLTILAGLPEICQVFLTGDLQQLPAYSENDVCRWICN
ncbi:unnamed protein product [Anisakis simplex]|uniref:DNA helicase n=1 Tax=Anisakis simplex TaxID=6269 RepID=A0A0M3K7I4_ANISI|nr:unnamed protein product [Anisakis simplex]